MKIYDNVIDKNSCIGIYNYLLKQEFKVERDTESSPIAGLSHNLDNNSNLFSFLQNIIFSIDSNFSNKKLQRAYANLFAPHEKTYWHKDGNVDTFLFYINPEYGINECGETQFMIDGKITGILPLTGRLVHFDGQLLHKANSYYNHHRLSIALKYYKEL